MCGDYRGYVYVIGSELREDVHGGGVHVGVQWEENFQRGCT